MGLQFLVAVVGQTLMAADLVVTWENLVDVPLIQLEHLLQPVSWSAESEEVGEVLCMVLHLYFLDLTLSVPVLGLVQTASFCLLVFRVFLVVFLGCCTHEVKIPTDA